MDLSVLIPSFLRALAGALTSQAFAGTRFTAMLADITALGALLVELGEEGQAKLRELSEHIQAMVIAGQPPTPADWAKLNALHTDARRIIETYLAAQLLPAGPAPAG
jgi:hypothetical protein